MQLVEPRPAYDRSAKSCIYILRKDLAAQFDDALA
jgi:hypothetical protein